ncbi:MAG: preprotein translocase subunit TatB [Clostridiales bacterium]|nr:preprotein translocase subunit TatB [Clostridiales bacterium]
MKDNIIDARGRACPEPVLMSKKAIEKSPEGIKIIVDNVTAIENIRRFASNSGYSIEVLEQDDDFILTLGKK